MTYKATIWQEIRENSRLRMLIAMELNIGEQAVRMAALRKSNSLTKYAAVQVLKSELGLTEQDLFEQETAKP